MNFVMNTLEKNRIELYADQLFDWLMGKMFDIIVAIIFIIVGLKVSKFIVKAIKRSFDKGALESSVSGFLLSLIKGVLYIVVFTMGAAIMGFQVTSLVTILGTASLAIGLALQGSLANFAGGVLILIMKPFKVGDYIIQNENGCEGTVSSIDIFYTKLKTVDNKIIVIPNGNITSGTITNVTIENKRRLDLLINISYSSDLLKVKDMLKAIAIDSEYNIEKNSTVVYVDSLGDHSVVLGLRLFVKTQLYWNAKWELLEKMKIAFDENGIEIPYNHLEVIVSDRN